MKNTTTEKRGDDLARWAQALVVSLGAAGCMTGCMTSSYGWYEPTQAETSPQRADLALEIDALAEELSQRAGLRIPLGSARVVIDDPVPIRGKSSRYRPAGYGERERDAARAAIRFELEMALGNRMNVVGARDLGAGLEDPGAPAGEVTVEPSLAMRAARTRATHALLGTFVTEGEELELSIQLVELDSEWIVATARRRIVGFEPDGYDERYGAPGKRGGDEVEQRMTAEVVPIADERIGVVASAQEPAVEPAADPGKSDAAEVVELPVAEDAPIEFSEGPAAVRLRALEARTAVVGEGEAVKVDERRGDEQ